jgi:hypothetical protein
LLTTKFVDALAAWRVKCLQDRRLGQNHHSAFERQNSRSERLGIVERFMWHLRRLTRPDMEGSIKSKRMLGTGPM